MTARSAPAPPTVPFAGRDALARRPRSAELVRGSALKADVYEVELDGRRLVVKDFAAKPRWARPLGRWQIARECRAYRALGPREWLAPFVGRIDAHALALAHVDGERVDRVDESDARAPRWMAAIERVVRELHEADVAHLDLRSRENVLLGADGGVVVVDLASSLAPPHRVPGRRALVRLLQRVDRGALAKWRGMLALGPLDDQERERERRRRRWRRLWVFNRKRQDWPPLDADP